jgi:proteasome lid subunit RPN8/RPN11
MFYVSIPKEVLNKVMDSAKSTDKEVIGVLIGKIEKHTVVVEDAVSGEQESDNTRAVLPPKTIAEVTDKILKGDIKGRIVGWYHSHPGFGIFMSGTDINTQRNLQQFSSNVTALIVEPDDEERGFFTLHEDHVVQLEDDQVHVYEEGEEAIPERFSSPPKVPKPKKKRVRKMPKPFMPMPESHGMNTKVIALGLAAAMIGLAIVGMIIFWNIDFSPKISKVDDINLIGENRRNQQDIPLFNDMMEVQANITIGEGSINESGVRFYIGLEEEGWHFLGNENIPNNSTYTLAFNTSRHDEGLHQIKVNFTDNKENTWEKVSMAFIIDNVPDSPQVRVLDPDEGDIINENIIIYAEIMDPENNIHSVGFYYQNASINETKINPTEHVGGAVYKTTWGIGPLTNGTYDIRVKAEDRNLYMDEDMITVTILHGG